MRKRKSKKKTLRQKQVQVKNIIATGVFDSDANSSDFFVENCSPLGPSDFDHLRGNHCLYPVLDPKPNFQLHLRGTGASYDW